MALIDAHPNLSGSSIWRSQQETKVPTGHGCQRWRSALVSDGTGGKMTARQWLGMG